VQIKPSQFQIRIQSQDSNLKIEDMLINDASVSKFWEFIGVESDLPPKSKFVPGDFSTSVQIYKNYDGQNVFVSRVQTELINSVCRHGKIIQDLA
jgi:hypothetical protein